MRIFSGFILYITIVSVLYATNEVWSQTNIKRYTASYDIDTPTGREAMELDR